MMPVKKIIVQHTHMRMIKTWTEQEFFDSYIPEGWMLFDKWIEENPDADMFVIVGNNSIGKSYSLMQLLVKEIKKQIEHIKQTGTRSPDGMIWCRNLKEEAKRCVDGWQDMITASGLNRTVEITPQGIYYDKSVALKGKWRAAAIREQKFPRVLIMPFVYWNSTDASTPPLEGTKYIVSDEFLSGNEKSKFVMKDWIGALRKLTKRTRAHFNTNGGRTVNCFIANPHTPESDLFSQLELDFSWKDIYNDQNIFIKYETSTGLRVCFAWCMNIDRIQNEYLQAQNREDKRWGTTGYDKELWNPRYKNIFPALEDIEYSPICAVQTYKKLNTNVVRETVLLSTYTYNGEQFIYCSPYKGEDVPIYSIEAVAHGEDCYLQDKESVWNKLEWLSDAHMNSIIRFSSPYIRGCMTTFLERLDRVRAWIQAGFIRDNM